MDNQEWEKEKEQEEEMEEEQEEEMEEEQEEEMEEEQEGTAEEQEEEMEEEQEEEMEEEQEGTAEDDLEALKRTREQERKKLGIDEEEENREFRKYMGESIKGSKRLKEGGILIPYAKAYYKSRGMNPAEVTKFLSGLDRGNLGGFGRFLEYAEIQQGEVQPTSEEEKMVYKNMILGIAVLDEVEKTLQATLNNQATLKEDVERVQAGGIGSLPYWDIETINEGSKRGTRKRMEIVGLMDEVVPTETELLKRVWDFNRGEEELPTPPKVEERISEIEKDLRDVEGSTEVPYVVSADVEGIIKRLDNIYGTVKKGEFAGIVTKTGDMVKMYDSHQNERLQNYNEFILTVFNAYNDEVLDNIEGAIGEIGDTTLTLDKKYNPGWHLNNLRTNKEGRTYWELGIKEEFREYCQRILNAEYQRAVTKNARTEYTEYVLDIRARVTNVVLMRQANRNTMLFRVMGIDKERTESFRGRFDEELSKYRADRSNIGIGACRTALDNVTYLSLIYDVRHFEDEMLFGYKRIENLDNFVPDLTDVVLGVGLDGEPVRVNLMSEAGKMTQILAGSRSGKGVMTMSFMSTIQATGGSIVYMDYKPDIGAMLWQLEDIIAREEGLDVKFLSMDAMNDVSTFNGARPTRYEPNKFREGIPQKCMADMPDENAWKSIRLMKLILLTDLLSEYQDKYPNAPAGDIFMIIDEIKLLSKPLEKVEQYVTKRVIAADEEAHPGLTEYKTRLKNVFEDSVKSVTEGIEAKWAPLGVRVILIGQVYDRNWGAGQLSSSLLNGVKRTIAGKGQVSRTNTELQETEYELIGAGNDTNKGRGMFIVTDSKIGPPKKAGNLTAMGIPTLSDDMKVTTPQFFKSYFTIIENDLDVEEYEEQRDSGNLTAYWGATGTKFTTELLKYAGAVGSEKYQKAEADLYNPVTKELNPSVGYKGLLDVVVDKANLDKKEFYQNLNNGYARYERLFEEIKPYLAYEYENIEEYIADLRLESLNSKMELQQMVEGVAPIAERQGGEEYGGFDGGIDPLMYDDQDIFEGHDPIGNWEEAGYDDLDDTDPMPEEEEEYDPMPEDEGYDTMPEEEEYDTEEEGGQQEDRREQRQEDYIGGAKEKKTRTEKTKNPEKRRNESRVLESRIVVPDSKNPFLLYQGTGNISTVNKKIDMSRIILNNLGEQMGGLSNITEFRINGDKTLTVNGVGYRPSFDLDFLKTIAPYQRGEVRDGGVGSFIYFKHVLAEMPRLTTIELEPKEIGESSALNELGYRKVSDYKKLYKKMDFLTKIVICGENITPDAETETEKEEARGTRGFGLGSKIAGLFKFGGRNSEEEGRPNPMGEQMLDSVVNSAPVKIMGTALGWTAGVKATIWMASMMGPFGLLFGALAMGGAYKESQKRK